MSLNRIGHKSALNSAFTILVKQKGTLPMCHGYEMSWWKSKATVKAKETARQDERAKPATEEKAKDKELIPAE
jgi:hypothetical protein